MNSIFASQTKSNPIPVPFGEAQESGAPHTIVVRKLTGREYEAACDAHRGSVATGRANAWPALFRKALTAGANDPDVLKAVADPLSGHDRYALMRSGLVSWTYPESIAVIPATPGKPAVPAQGDVPAVAAVDPTPAVDNLSDLDDDTVDFIAREVLRLTKPGLFVPPEAVEELQKKSPAAASPA